ncbi:hypothetical protein ACVMB3_000265 [Sinorhizobium meliloti]
MSAISSACSNVMLSETWFGRAASVQPEPMMLSTRREVPAAPQPSLRATSFSRSTSSERDQVSAD